MTTQTKKTTKVPAGKGAARATRTTKLDAVIALLQRSEGAGIIELMSATGWQQHSVRGVLAGSLKKKGLPVISTVRDGERRYSIGAA